MDRTVGFDAIAEVSLRKLKAHTVHKAKVTPRAGFKIFYINAGQFQQGDTLARSANRKKDFSRLWVRRYNTYGK
jgi:hypothetical protein